MKWNLLPKRAFVLSISCCFLMAGAAFAEKSMWEKVKDFFSPTESFDCEGPLCDEIHDLESRISRTEGKYSRERRPVNKERYKKELDALNASRDSLITVYKTKQPSAASVASVVSSASLSSSSSVVAAISSSAVSSSSAAPAVQPVLSGAQVLSATEVAALVCKPDTVFVRDTVKVHDTVYVIVTNKPVEVPVSSASPENLK